MNNRSAKHKDKVGDTMKTLMRNICVALFLSPLIVHVYLRSIFIGKKKAVAFAGPALTRAAKRSLRYWVPVIEGPEDFDRFAPAMKSRFRLWKPLFDIAILEETGDTFKIRVSNCPFYEVLVGAGLRELGPYVCAGDWAVARDNADKWSFDRKHQIGTGDDFCDHTYIRLRSVK
jgi:hypothetical protein